MSATQSASIPFASIRTVIEWASNCAPSAIATAVAQSAFSDSERHKWRRDEEAGNEN